MTPPRFLVVGAGSRGAAYAKAVFDSGRGQVVAVAEPLLSKRKRFASQYIWPSNKPHRDQEFDTWEQFVDLETKRQQDLDKTPSYCPTIDGVFICVQDELHVKVITALAPLGLHIMSEKPLATTMGDCMRIQKSLQDAPAKIFAVGHVLRYSPHNMLLRQLVLEEEVIGDILSVEHTEPVGWWHFSHSYVRGNWRKESKAAASLLTKSCHDIDFLLWMMCGPKSNDHSALHLPSRISSAGSLQLFRRQRKPAAAKNATNCMSCPIKDSCKFSAPRIYHDRHLAGGHVRWPVDTVNPEIESIAAIEGFEAAKKSLLHSLAEDYDVNTADPDEISKRPWYGRCVWESDNDVCDDQFVMLEWDDMHDPQLHDAGYGAKTASFHMVANTLAQCERRGRIYGTEGEISYDSTRITVHDFSNDSTRSYDPEVPENSHHGGGDFGLTEQFVKAVTAVKSGDMSVRDSQIEFMGCTLEDVIRSHAVVFAAEEARREHKVISWPDWWERCASSKPSEHID